MFDGLVKNLIGKGLGGLAGLVAGEKGKEVVNKVTDFLGCGEDDIIGKLNDPETVKALKGFEIEEMKLHNEEMANVREREIKISQSEHSSWLQKNAAALIGIFIILYTFILFTLILAGYVRTEKDIVILILTSVTGLCGLVVGYYFGSSVGSKKKDGLLQVK